MMVEEWVLKIGFVRVVLDVDLVLRIGFLFAWALKIVLDVYVGMIGFVDVVSMEWTNAQP